jgi:hypothetical protein
MSDFDLGKIKITEIMKIKNNDTDEIFYLTQINDEWKSITENEYKKLIEVE